MTTDQLTQATATGEETAGEVILGSSGPEFETLKAQVQATFNERMALYGPGLFVTKSKGLSTVYRKAFPEEEQQHHNCSGCRRFFERFGHLVFVTPEGELVSALWDPSVAPEEYKASVAAIEALVLRSGISDRFYTELTEWGTGETKGWTHYQLTPVQNHIVLEHQLPRYEGDGRTSFDMLLKAVNSFTVQVAAAAVNQIRSGGKGLERWLPQLEWFHTFRKTTEDKSIGEVRNLVWREVATVHPAFAGIANNVEGRILLGGIAEGRPPEAALRSFVMQVDPEFYRQKTAAPTEGNVSVAQKRFEELGLSGDDLERRAARIDEVRCWWKPAAAPEAAVKAKPLFGDLVTKEATAAPVVSQKAADGGKITWEKFKTKVLPEALEINAYATTQEKYVYFSQAAKPDAGRIWFYDQEGDRNTMAWHTTNEAQTARQMGVNPGQLLPVVGIALPPACWTGGDRAQKYMLDLLLVEGLKDPREKVGLALFSELLRSELVEVDRVIQAHSLKGKMDTTGDNQAVALDSSIPRRVQVRTEFGLTDYVIDRLE
jgi:hypothetical protein